MRQELLFQRLGITERAISDFERENECSQEVEQRSGYGDKQVERWRES